MIGTTTTSATPMPIAYIADRDKVRRTGRGAGPGGRGDDHQTAPIVVSAPSTSRRRTKRW